MPKFSVSVFQNVFVKHFNNERHFHTNDTEIIVSSNIWD